MPPAMGLPTGFQLSFDSFTIVLGLAAIATVAVLALLLWFLRVRDVARHHVRCPIHGVTARIDVRTRPDGRVDVDACSLCPWTIDCGTRCLRSIA